MGKKDWRDLAKLAGTVAAVATVVGIVAKKLGQ
jgi:hypothetical protein